MVTAQLPQLLCDGRDKRQTLNASFVREYPAISGEVACLGDRLLRTSLRANHALGIKSSALINFLGGQHLASIPDSTKAAGQRRGLGGAETETQVAGVALGH